MCRTCVRAYEKKYTLSSHNMKCPFCNSETSTYLDYELEAKQYFDTSGKIKHQKKESSGELNKNASKYLEMEKN